MLNAYPDSLGGNLGDIANFLSRKELKDVFSSFYILPSLFHTDLDRGFSVIDYSLNEMLAKREDLEKLDELGVDLKLDFILNHASVLSKELSLSTNTLFTFLPIQLYIFFRYSLLIKLFINLYHLYNTHPVYSSYFLLS